MPPPDARPSGARLPWLARSYARPQLVLSLRVALGACAAAGLALLAVEAVLVTEAADLVALTFPAVAAIYLAAGVRAWWRRPGSRLGVLILQGCLALASAGLASTASPALSLVGRLTMTWILALFVHLLLVFPSGRLRHRLPRAVVAAGYANSLALQVPQVLGGPALAQAAALAQRGLGTTVMASTAAILVAKLRAASPAQRWTLVPLYGYGLVVAGLIPLSTILLRGLLGVPALEVGLCRWPRSRASR